MKHRLPKPLLRAARTLLGVSQRHVSRAAAVSTGTVAHIESDHRIVKLETELAVSAYYEDCGVEFVIEDDRIGVFMRVDSTADRT